MCTLLLASQANNDAVGHVYPGHEPEEAEGLARALLAGQEEGTRVSVVAHDRGPGTAGGKLLGRARVTARGVDYEPVG